MKIAVLSDLREERWPSMDLVTEMLAEHAGRLPGVEAVLVRPELPRPLQGFAAATKRRWLRPASLALGRYVLYPFELSPVRGRYDFFHVADHSYAHLALRLPAGRTGVFCHDIDVFRPLFSRGARWRRVLASALLAGLRRASVVFYSTEAVRKEIVARALVAPDRLVAAPYGIAEEFRPEPADPEFCVRSPYVLHVGSLIKRKNPEFLLRLFAELHAGWPALRLVQVGGSFEGAERRFIQKAGLSAVIDPMRDLSRSELAALYRGAVAVLMPSRQEGFGLPIVEALACGAAVVASDIPVLRQVGEGAVVYRPLDDLDAWRAAVLDVVAGRAPGRAVRLATAARYSWASHAETVVRGYRTLEASRCAG